MAMKETADPGDEAKIRRNLEAGHWEGYIDAVEGGRVYGWALDPSDKARRLSVTLQHGSEELATLVAERFREDLVGYGDGSGHHAFVHTLPRHLWDSAPDEFHAHFTGTDVPLLRGHRLTALAVVSTSEIQGESGGADQRADERRLAGRIESLERSIIGMMRLIDPQSGSMRRQSQDVEKLQSDVAVLRSDIRAIEPFLIRLDERLKRSETGPPGRREGRRIGAGAIAVGVLLVITLALGYVAIGLIDR